MTTKGQVVNLEEMLGIDPNDPRDQHAGELVASDGAMLDALVALRCRQGLTQTAVAERMGVSPSAVSRIESAERDPHLSTLRRYAMAVGAVVHHDVRLFERTAARAAVVAYTDSGRGMQAWSEQTEFVGSLVTAASLRR